MAWRHAAGWETDPLLPRAATATFAAVADAAASAASVASSAAPRALLSAGIATLLAVFQETGGLCELL